jgi:hypothetical protein
MKRIRATGRLSLLVGLLLLAGAGLAYAQTGAIYELVAWTVDDGGDTPITGGDYDLLSTVGQPEAAPDVRGGAYIVQSGFWPSRLQRAFVFLPIVMKDPKPDLVGSFGLSPDKSDYGANESVLVTAVVTNVGAAAADPFWVDFYINPSRTPTVNDPWNKVCGLSPCYGIAWYVSGGLSPGASVTLRSNCADPAQYPHEPCYGSQYSVWPGHFAGGTRDLYLYVDSWNRTVSSGGVGESNEANNLSERHGLTVTGLGADAAGRPSAADLPPRPAPSGR